MTERLPTYYVFISHVHEEAEVARVLKGWFEAAFPAGLVAAFVSSDYEDNPLGRRWLDVIDGAMDKARLVITHLSPRSMDRMWIHLETGWALGRKVDILPICHSGTKINGLPRPYVDYGGTEVERDDFARGLLIALKERLRLHHDLPPGMLEGLTNDVRKACAKIVDKETHTKGPATPPRAVAAKPELGEPAKQLLIGLSSVHTGSDEGVPVYVLANALKMSAARVIAHARPLEEGGLIRQVWALDDERHYTITDRGLMYLEERGLLT